MVAVRWYLRYGLSYRDVEELLAERGIAVDHVTVYRWVQRFTPLLLDAARPCRHAPGIDGSLTKRIPRLPGGGSTFTVRSTSSGRSLTYWARAIVKTCGWGLLDESLGESFGVECPDGVVDGLSVGEVDPALGEGGGDLFGWTPGGVVVERGAELGQVSVDRVEYGGDPARVDAALGEGKGDPAA